MLGIGFTGFDNNKAEHDALVGANADALNSFYQGCELII